MAPPRNASLIAPPSPASSTSTQPQVDTSYSTSEMHLHHASHPIPVLPSLSNASTYLAKVVSFATRKQSTSSPSPTPSTAQSPRSSRGSSRNPSSAVVNGSEPASGRSGPGRSSNCKSLPTSPIQRYEWEKAQWEAAFQQRRGSALDPEYTSFPDFDSLTSALSPSPAASDASSVDSSRSSGS